MSSLISRFVPNLATAGLIVGLAATCMAQSGALSLSMGDSQAVGTISLNVILSGNGGASAIQWLVNSDIGTFTSTVGPAGQAANKTLTCSGNRCILYGPDSRTVPNGTIGTLTFQLAANAPNAVQFQVSGAAAASSTASLISLDTSSGALSFNPQPAVFPPALLNTLSFAGSAPQVASSGGWETTAHLINTTTTPANARVETLGDGGDLLTGTVIVKTFNPPVAFRNATVDQTIAAGAMGVVTWPDMESHGMQVGSARISTGGGVGGFIRFRHGPSGQEAAVPFETRIAASYVLPFDNTSGAATGIAVANLTAAPVGVPVVIRDRSGMQLETGSITLPSNGHATFSLSDRFASSAGIDGTVEFDTPSDGRIGVMGMNFPSTGGFTAIPVAAGLGLSSGSVAHLAVGQGWTTTIQLINSSNAATQAHLRFFDDDGNALAVPYTLGGASHTADFIDPVLPPYSVITTRSLAPEGPVLLGGAAHLTSDGPVNGFVRFRYEPTGQEMVIPFETRKATSYFLAFDNRGGMATGIALANVSPSGGHISALIRNTAGVILGVENVTLPAKGHRSFDLSQQIPATVDQSGTIEFITPTGGQINVLGVRFQASGDYSTIPVITP